MQDESARQRGWWKWKWKDLKSASLEIRKTLMAPKRLIYIPLNQKMAPASDWLLLILNFLRHIKVNFVDN